MWFSVPSKHIRDLGQSLKYGIAHARSISSNQSDPRLIILNPRQAGLVKAKPRRPKRRESRSTFTPQHIQVTPLDTLDESSIPTEPVVSAIHSQRPESLGIAKERFEQIRDELARGFKKSHLEDYLKAQKVSPSLYNRFTKSKMAQYIMTGVWNCFVRDEAQQYGGGVFKENVLELSEQDLVLVLGSNGRLLREWSKSGAKISISPSRCQIIVNSTQETFDWINASLSHFLESVMTTEIDMTELKQLVDPQRFPEHLATIQQLTDTYFRGGGDNSIASDSIVVYSAGHNRVVNTNVVRRLLVQLCQPALSKIWKPADWWFDTTSIAQSQSMFYPFDDTDSMEWMERMRQWSRWERVKTKHQSSVSRDSSDSAYDLKCLSTPEFMHPEEKVGINLPLADQVQNVVKQLAGAHPVPQAWDSEAISTTLTMTPGYVLHESDDRALVPNAGMPKTFCSNIPSVANFASTLSLFSKDIRQEDPVSESQPRANNTSLLNENLDSGSWSDLLNFDSEVDSEGRKVFASRRKELDLQPNLRLIQMKFIANPQLGQATHYPPIEAWAELPPFNVSNNSLLQQVPRIVAVPTEASSHISLPDHKADLKVTLAHTFPISITPNIEEYFMKKCRFGRVGPIEIKPELEVEIGGENVSYLYHSAAYVTLAELEFRNNLLQLSQVEGGKLGGRKIEASLVEHCEHADEFDLDRAAQRSANNVLAFTDLM